MDSQDTRTALERFDQTEKRIAALAEQGVDTAGLHSQLAFARAALAQGNTVDVITMCEEILIAAKRLLAAPPAAASRPVKTDRVGNPPEQIVSGLYPTPTAHAVTSAEQPVERRGLTEEIRQAVQADYLPKALTPAQLSERIRTTVEQTLGTRLQALGEHLSESLSATLDDRFKRLAAEPSTTLFTKPPNVDELVAQVEARLATAVDKRLEARGAGIAKHTAQAIAEATSGIEARLNELADPERLRQAVVRAVESVVDEALARAELARAESATGRSAVARQQQDSTETTLAQLSATVHALDRALPECVAQAVAAALPEAMNVAMGPVRTLISETMSTSAGPDLEALATRMGKDLRTDLDWQVERLAAEKGWVTLADVHAELRNTVAQGGGSTTGTIAPGFARLEATLVEFVRQSQSQQQQFLNVLQERVEQGTAVIAQNLAKAIAGHSQRSSAVFRQMQKPGQMRSELEKSDQLKTGDGETGVLNRATDARAVDEQSALESHASTLDRELDVLSMTAQVRAIDTFGDPQRSPSTVLSELNAASQPPTLVTQKNLASDSAANGHDQPSSAARPATMAIPHNEALIPSARPVTYLVDPSAITVANGDPAANLGSDVLELSALNELTDDPSGLKPTATSTVAQAHFSDASDDSDDSDGSRRVTRVIEAARDAHAPSHSAPAATATHASSPVGAFEAGLRTLIAREVELQLSGGLSARLRTALGLQHLPTASDLDARIHRAMQTAALHPQTSRHASPSATSHLSLGSDSDLRAALLRSLPSLLPELLRDPAVRQQILGVVAVEAVTNPGALGELTGIRAFIRAEIRHATKVDMGLSQNNDAASDAVSTPAAKESATTLTA